MRTLLSPCQRSIKAIFGFSTGPLNNKGSLQGPQDWQYCKLISQELKNKNINAGLSLLFQSYLNGKILDIQIYNTIFQALTQQSLPITYSQIVYQIYREHFPPQTLMLSWMNKLAGSHDDSFIDKLKLDFEAIHHPFPKKIKRDNRVYPAIKESGQEQVKSRKSRMRRHNETQDEGKTGNSRPIRKEEQLDNKSSAEQALKQKIQTNFKNVLQDVNSGIGRYSKINLFDVEIEFNQDQTDTDQHDNDIYEEEDQNDQIGGDGDMTPVDLGLLGLDISKIKIGRVEFIADHTNHEPTEV